MSTQSIFLNKVLSYCTFITVLAGAFWVIFNTFQNQPQTLQTIQQEPLLSGLALEGRDIFYSQGCAVCHSGDAVNAPLILAGALFAPPYPFEQLSMTPEQLKNFLLGPGTEPFVPISQEEYRAHLTHDETVKANTNTANTAIIDESALDETLFHLPTYPHLQAATLNGHETQAKMLALNNSAQTYDISSLVTASEQTAGTTKINALIAYLQESTAKTRSSR